MKTRKNKNSKTESRIILAILLVVLFAIAGIIGQIRQHSRDEYARRNNCEWRATGSFYGDDRDFICKTK